MKLRHGKSTYGAVLGSHFAFSFQQGLRNPLQNGLTLRLGKLILVLRRHGLVLQLIQNVLPLEELFIFQTAVENIHPNARFLLLLSVAIITVTLQNGLHDFLEP